MEFDYLLDYRKSGVIYISEIPHDILQNFLFSKGYHWIEGKVLCYTESKAIFIGKNSSSLSYGLNEYYSDYKDITSDIKQLIDSSNTPEFW